MPVTLETIARRVGFSRVTVSLALRGSRRISEQTRAQIHAAAAELGYIPNPMISALMVSIRTRRSSGRSFNLCFLTAFPTRDSWRDHPVFCHYHQGASERAAALGYGLEVHWSGDTGDSPTRLTQILESRGIPGVIIAPLPVGASPIALDWKRFATVALGHTFKQSPTHRVTNHQLHTITSALEACHARGYQRIGLAVTRRSDERVEHSWLAGMLSFQATHASLRKIPPFLADPFTESDFLDWFRLTRPDVVVTTDLNAAIWLRKNGFTIPDEVGYVHLDWTPERGDLAAMDQNPRHIGQAATDLLVEQINQNHRGPPSVTKTVMVESFWRDGPTLPVRPPHTHSTRAKSSLSAQVSRPPKAPRP